MLTRLQSVGSRRIIKKKNTKGVIMRLSLIALLLLAGGLSADEAKEGQSFLCIPDKSVGFKFNDRTKEWDQADFRVGDDKYIVRPTTDEDASLFLFPVSKPYAVWILGEDYPDVFCNEGISEFHWLKCGENPQFFLNTYTNRFMYIYHGSYMAATIESGGRDEEGNLTFVDREDTGGDTPIMEIGKCSKL